MESVNPELGFDEMFKMAFEMELIEPEIP